MHQMTRTICSEDDTTPGRLISSTSLCCMGLGRDLLYTLSMLVRVGRKGKRSSTAITWPADILLLAAPEVNMLSATRTMAGSHMISSMATPYMLRVVSGSSRRASTSLDRTSADRIVILSMAMHGEVIVMLIDFFSFNQYCSCTVSRMFKVTGKGEHLAARERKKIPAESHQES